MARWCEPVEDPSAGHAMNLAPPPNAYSPRYMIESNRAIEQADAVNVKRGRDYEVGQGRVILTASDGTRWALTVSVTGVLGTVAL